MNIQLNGRTVKLPEDVNNIDDLLQHYDLQDRIVVVEVNKEIAEKQQYHTLSLSDRDTVEIIHFVGGG